MTWVDRILATPCPNGHIPGEPCSSGGYGVPLPMFCTSRIQAAEGTAKPGPAVEWRFTTEQFKQFLVNGGLTTAEAEQIVRDHNPPPGPSACPGRRP